MSIIKPHKLGIIAGPGSEYFAGKVTSNLRKSYIARYDKVSKILAKRHNLSEEQVLRNITFLDDIQSKNLISSKMPDKFYCPNFDVEVKYTRFVNGEVKAEIQQPVRGLHMYIIYDVSSTVPIQVAGLDTPTVLSINDHLMFLFTTIGALEASGAESITLVLPTYPYARQHKRGARESLTASMFARFCEQLSVNRIITLDIHSIEIEMAFTRCHLDNLHGSYQILSVLKDIINLSDPDIVVVSPDTGAVSRNKFYAQGLHRPLAMLYKERNYSLVSRDAKTSNIQSIKLLGDVKGKTVIMADDMIATGGTMIIAMKELMKLGAKRIICIVSLPFFDGSAVENFDQAYKDNAFYRIIGTNAVYNDKKLLEKEWFVQADVSDLFARTISRIHHGRSLSPLLHNRNYLQKLIDSTQEGETKNADV